MIRILIIEFMLSGVIGAVVFRLAWAFTKQTKPAWGAIIVVAIVVVLVPGSVDGWMLHEAGPSLAREPHASLVLALLRGVALIAGAWLTSAIVAKRKRMGLEDEPRYKDFP
ncbi:MAG TPA: hypothetical protein VND24_06315 [Steroidobacteraceae bacterium]|nr:hypothetical protein [Steroidobacteraceae bacterium]